MEVHVRYMTRNDCYTANRKIVPKGIMVHSTATPGVMAASWFDRWNKSFRKGETNRQVCVHAFVDDRELWQYLPWNHRGWHCGGEGNNRYIGIEMCEPAGFRYSGGATMVGYDVVKMKPYFDKVYANIVEVCIMLCKEYGFDEKMIIDHYEASRLGLGSNHADVHHWFYRHGKSMDTLRADVKAGLAKKPEVVMPAQPVVPAERIVYTVQRGDTLSAIAKKYKGVTWKKIAEVNGIKNANLIFVGQKLVIPTE